MDTTLNEALPPEALRRSLYSRSDELSMLPAVANEALALAKDPNCTTGQFAAVVERDVELAAEILALANCPVFSAGASIANLRQAIVRLGFRQCRNLILTSSASSLIKSLPLEQEWMRELLWQHSFTTATACLHLNRTLNLGFQGEEFTAGLLHDFGRLLLAIAAPDSYADVDRLDFDESEDVLQRERDLLGTDHAGFGAWFAKENGLPRSLNAAIRYHHQPDIEHEDERLIALVAAGDDIANHIQRYNEPHGYDVSANRGIKQLSAKFGIAFDEQFGGIANTLIEEIIRDIALNSNQLSGMS